jgi:hypothetical protein
MTIADPRAIPETEHDAHEYVTEADQAWDSGDSERAYALYHAVFQSHFAARHQRSVAAYRCGLTKLNEGDTEMAHEFLNASGRARRGGRAARDEQRHPRRPDAECRPRSGNG